MIKLALGGLLPGAGPEAGIFQLVQEAPIPDHSPLLDPCLGRMERGK